SAEAAGRSRATALPRPHSVGLSRPRYLRSVPTPCDVGAAGARQETDRMAKIQAVWALDVGQAALKALKLVPGEAPDQVLAEAFDFVEYPKILSQPDADPEQLVREALE